MRRARRRALIAVAVLLPAVLVYTARHVAAPVPATDRTAAVPPVFVGRLTPAQTIGSVGRPMRVTVEISADRPVPLDAIRVWVSDGRPAEIRPFTVGTEPRTVPFDVVFTSRGDHALVLQVRLAGDTPWSNLPPSAKVIVA